MTLITKGMGIIKNILTKKQYKKKLDKLLGPGDEVFGSPMKDWYMKKFNKPKAKNVTPKGKK
jgi:hypothetical protein